MILGSDGEDCADSSFSNLSALGFGLFLIGMLIIGFCFLPNTEFCLFYVGFFVAAVGALL